VNCICVGHFVEEDHNKMDGISSCEECPYRQAYDLFYEVCFVLNCFRDVDERR